MGRFSAGVKGIIYDKVAYWDGIMYKNYDLKALDQYRFFGKKPAIQFELSGRAPAKQIRFGGEVKSTDTKIS